MSARSGRRYVALSGGVGGAKLALGLAHLLGEQLTIIVNTGDDFEHLGLHISPDIDTVALHAGRPRQPRDRLGPPRRDLDFHAGASQQLGGPAWFRLGDRDLATHVERTRRLRAGRR